MVAEVSSLAPADDGYEKAVIEIEKYRASSISVPMLSRLLGVKTTTINARFRREGVHANTVGRTNFIPSDVALSLADLHRHALRGWPTLQEVSRATGIKTGTLKARCEKGRLEGYVDLTKRLRINPAEVPHLSLERQGRSRITELHFNNGAKISKCETPSLPRSGGEGRGEEAIIAKVRDKVVEIRTPLSGSLPARSSRGEREIGRSVSLPGRSSGPTSAPVRKPFVLPPAPEPRVQVITASDYGLPAHNNGTSAGANGAKIRKEKKRGALDYNPERPFSIAECSVGKTVKYEKYDGTIVKLIPDPFNPAIKVALPKHEEPLMREILLRVAR